MHVHENRSIPRAYALTISSDRFARGQLIATYTAAMNTMASSLTRRHVPLRCSRITTSRPNESKTVTGTVFDPFDYKPFGPNEGWDWGNSGVTLSSNPPLNQHLRQYDLDYRPITIASDPDGYHRQINWDRANRITAITIPNGITLPGIANANSLNQAFAYDQLDRLTQFNAGTTGATTLATGMALLPNEQFSYDAIGNRLSRTTTAPETSTNQTANYAYPNLSTTSGTKSHTLTGITGASAGGTRNNATLPWLQSLADGYSPPFTEAPLNPILSYITIDHSTGQQMVVNVTLPGHSLWPGYTARTINQTSNGTSLVTYGEGLGALQSDRDRAQRVRNSINNIWFSNQQSIVNSCGCR
jgi:hypothetical protein